MSSKQISIESILKSNPQVSESSLKRVDELLKRLDQLGIKNTEYRLAPPFSGSLKRMIKRSRALRKVHRDD